MLRSKEERKAICMLLGAVYLPNRGYFSRLGKEQRFDEKTLEPITNEEYEFRREYAIEGKPWYE